MSYRVVFAPEASDQLEALFIYIAERSSPMMAERLIQCSASLTRRPAIADPSGR